MITIGKSYIGVELLKAIGRPYFSNPVLEFNENKAKECLAETKKLLRSKVNLKKNNEEQFLIESLFKCNSKNDEKNYMKASYQVLDGFLEFFIKNLKEEHIPIIENFVYSLSLTDFLKGEKFLPVPEGVNTIPTYFHAMEIINVFYEGKHSNYISRVLCFLLCLRQCLEIRFKRILGVSKITINDFPLKIPHDFIPDFIFKNKDKIKMNYDKNLQLIYQWTNHSIHSMRSPDPWLVWKALEFCKNFFAIDGSLYGSVKIKKEDFLELRKAFEQKIKDFAIRKNRELLKSIKIYYYDHIEAELKDANEKLDIEFYNNPECWLFTSDYTEQRIPFK